MSVFASSQPMFFSPPSYSRHPAAKDAANMSTTSIPSSLSKLSLSLTSPIRNFFSSPDSTISNPSIALSPTTNGSSASFSSISTTSTNEIHPHPLSQEETNTNPLTVPPPTYSPIKTGPKLVSPPAYEPSISSASSTTGPQVRPQTPAPSVQPESDYSSGYHYGYVAESWAGSKTRIERLAEQREKEEAEEDSSCWCTSWWMVSGASGMPWVAYYIY